MDNLHPHQATQTRGEEGDQAGARWLYQAAIDCPHDIDKDTVVLHFSKHQPGKNALDQLGNRLSLYAMTRYKESDGDRLYKAAIDCQHEIDDGKIVLHFDPTQPGHNALNQLSKRLTACAKKIFC